MRHGEAEPARADDASRELVPTGVSDVVQVASEFSERFGSPHVLAYSPYERARQTAELMNRRLGVADTQVWDELVPSTDIGPAVSRLADRDKIMLVTHQPLIGLLADWLTGQQTVIHPGTLLVIETETLAAGWGDIRCVISA